MCSEGCKHADVDEKKKEAGNEKAIQDSTSSMYFDALDRFSTTSEVEEEFYSNYSSDEDVTE